MKKATWWTAARLVCVLVVLPIAATGTAAAQPPEGGARARGGQRQQGLPIAEVERLFDGYVAMQAQEALVLTDAQLPQFLARLKALQETRRRNAQERRQLVAQLNRQLKSTPLPEAPLRDALGRLRETTARNADELRKAYDAIDEVLDLGQQARFRVFEESVERRKFDLVLRARRSAMQREMEMR